jgi:hypothetical protein
MWTKHSVSLCHNGGHTDRVKSVSLGELREAESRQVVVEFYKRVDWTAKWRLELNI